MHGVSVLLRAGGKKARRLPLVRDNNVHFGAGRVVRQRHGAAGKAAASAASRSSVQCQWLMEASSAVHRCAAAAEDKLPRQRTLRRETRPRQCQSARPSWCAGQQWPCPARLAAPASSRQRGAVSDRASRKQGAARNRLHSPRRRRWCGSHSPARPAAVDWCAALWCKRHMCMVPPTLESSAHRRPTSSCSSLAACRSCSTRCSSSRLRQPPTITSLLCKDVHIHAHVSQHPFQHHRCTAAAPSPA